MQSPPGPSQALADEIIGMIPALRAYARSLVLNAVDGDDLVQETLTKAIANAEKFQPGTNLRAWLFTIMRNTFLTDIHRRNRERPGAEDCVSAEPEVQAGQEAHVMGQQLLAAVEALPLHYREMLVLVLMIGESYEDAARMCGVPVGTVKSRVNRARQMVIRNLGATDLGDALMSTG